jgi:hypothetical protein
MRRFDKHWLFDGVAKTMRRNAALERTYDGIVTWDNRALLDRCTGVHVATGTKLILTRDAGMHSSGWWKNPDYERCWHLSLSFFDPISGQSAPKDTRLTDKWIDAFYGENRRYLWSEPPFSEDGRRLGVWHYRVFCDAAWQPIIPRGEVYGRELTEAGWQSYSDLQNSHAKALAELAPLPGEQ